MKPTWSQNGCDNPSKTHPKYPLENQPFSEGILAPNMIQRASQNGAKANTNCVIASFSFSWRFFLHFGMSFSSIFQAPDPRSDFYLQYFRVVRHFAQSQTMMIKTASTIDHLDSNIASKKLSNLRQKCVDVGLDFGNVFGSLLDLQNG